MVGKIGGETISHLNSSSGSVDASLYYPGQKRPGEDGGEDETRERDKTVTVVCTAS